VGHDWGGAVAWVTAALDPKLVSTLTVLSTPHPDALSAGIADPMNPQHGASNYMIGFRAPDSQNRILANGLTGFKALFRLGGGSIPSKDIATDARVLGTPAALGAALDWYRANPLPSPMVGRVNVPTLYLWGSQDSVFLRSTAEASAKYVTGQFTFCVLAGRGHWLPEDAPRQILTALLSQLVDAHPRCPSS
jgi:pimeloyl-ACP methyl ester carboxylesterase